VHETLDDQLTDGGPSATPKSSGGIAGPLFGAALGSTMSFSNPLAANHLNRNRN